MIRRIIFNAAILVGMSAPVMGCSSAESVCSLMCECEHCNDYSEMATCSQLTTVESIAEAYECSEQWEAYMSCIEDKGTCDEEEANFRTTGDGSCSDTEPLGNSCATNADCSFGPPGGFCQGGECMARVCANSGGAWCETNADCPGAPLCETEEEAVDKCIDNASNHQGIGK